MFDLFNHGFYGAPHPRRMREIEVPLVVELVAGGELFEYLNENEFLEEPETASIIKQVLKAVAYLHNKRVAHLDLKPRNLMWDPGCFVLVSARFWNGFAV